MGTSKVYPWVRARNRPRVFAEIFSLVVLVIFQMLVIACVLVDLCSVRNLAPK
jgi:hypothetical protein